MTSVYDENMTAANAEQFEEFGEQVLYTPKGGIQTTVTACLDEIDTSEEEDELGEMIIKTRSVHVLSSEVASPSIEDIFTLNSETWIVTEIISEGHGAAELKCRWNRAQSKHHEMHKKKAD